MTMCYCGGHYRCEDCRRDVCFCACEQDGTPQDRSAVTAGYVNPSAAKEAAWNLKVEMSR